MNQGIFYATRYIFYEFVLLQETHSFSETVNLLFKLIILNVYDNLLQNYIYIYI